MRSSRVRPQSLVQVQAPLRFFVASALLLLAKMSATLRARRESLTPAQLRTALPKMMSVIRSKRASLLAELESMGGQAPTTADFPEPSRDELEREADAAALRQLILRAKSQWNEERASLRAAVEGAKEFALVGKYYYPQFLGPEEASALKDCLVTERAPYMVKYGERFRSTLGTRPKCNMGEPVDGAWPAYRWGQAADDLPLIELPPRLVKKMARRLEAHFGLPKGFLNSFMATFYYNGKFQFLVNHQDKGHSCQSTGRVENAAPIYNLSLGAPRNFVIADLKSLGKSKTAEMLIYASINMKSGDLVVLSPEVNTKWCHGVPQDPGAPADLRVSLVFRHCTKYWIRQLPDRTWEQCKRSATGEDGPWTPLNSSKDGEDDDQEVRLVERRRQAAAKIEEQQGSQKRGRKRPSTS